MYKALSLALVGILAWIWLMFGLAHFDPAPPPSRISDTLNPGAPSSLPGAATQALQRGAAADSRNPSVENATDAHDIDHRARRTTRWSAPHHVTSTAPDQHTDAAQHANDDITTPGALPLDEYVWRDVSIEDTELWRQAEAEPLGAFAESHDAGLAGRWMDQGGAATEKID